MKKGIAYTLVFALLLGLMLCVPLQKSAAMSALSADQQPDEMLTEAFTALTAAKNMHMDMDMTLDINVVISYGDQKMPMPLGILLTASMDAADGASSLPGTVEHGYERHGQLTSAELYVLYGEE